MSDEAMQIKNWVKFQHFKDRRPPWIKLYRDILDDPEWHSLDAQSSKVLIMLWLIASEDKTNQGCLPGIKRLAFRLRMGEEDLSSCLSRLSHWVYRNDIVLISPRHQDGPPETETETEKEGEKKGSVVVASRKKKEIDYQSIMDLWNTNTEGTPFPSLVAMTDKRKKLIKANIDDTPDWASMLVPVINHISGIEFFTGKNDRGWKASFDYLLQKGKLVELFEKSSSDLSVREPKIDLSPWEDPSYIARRPERAIS